MKITKDCGKVHVEEPFDNGAAPILSIYSKGDPRYNSESYLIRLQQVAVVDLVKMDSKIVGVPTAYALYSDLYTGTILLWPTPDCDYEAIFEFNPPRRRL